MPKKIIQSYSTVQTENPKFEKYKGLPQFSYSAYTSFKEDAYRGSFFADKLLGIPDPGNIFTDFGSGCGEYLESKGIGGELVISELLSEKDVEILNTVELPEDSEFEREIMIKREIRNPKTGKVVGEYCIIGYVDRNTRTPEAKIDVIDYKTGSAKKAKDYGGPDYMQTKLYAYALEKEGEEIGYVGVELLHRKGNNVIPGDKNVLRLEGTIEKIPTPYDKRDVEFFLEGFDQVAEEISDYITFYNKYFVD